MGELHGVDAEAVDQLAAVGGDHDRDLRVVAEALEVLLNYGDEPKRPGAPSGQLTFDVELLDFDK